MPEAVHEAGPQIQEPLLCLGRAGVDARVGNQGRQRLGELGDPLDARPVHAEQVVADALVDEGLGDLPAPLGGWDEAQVDVGAGPGVPVRWEP